MVLYGVYRFLAALSWAEQVGSVMSLVGLVMEHHGKY